VLKPRLAASSLHVRTALTHRRASAHGASTFKKKRDLRISLDNCRLSSHYNRGSAPADRAAQFVFCARQNLSLSFVFLKPWKYSQHEDVFCSYAKSDRHLSKHVCETRLSIEDPLHGVGARRRRGRHLWTR